MLYSILATPSGKVQSPMSSSLRSVTVFTRLRSCEYSFRKSEEQELAISKSAATKKVFMCFVICMTLM